jgi:anti-anti-sigma regulatory factor
MSTHSVVKVGRTCTGYRVRIEGRGTMRESPAVQQFALKALEAEVPSLALDLSACDYLDSTFLGCLLGLYKRFGVGHSPRLLIAAPPETRQRLLTPSHLDALIQTSGECPDVIGDDLTIPPLVLASRDLGKHILECHRRLAEIDGPNQAAFSEVVDRLAEELVPSGPLDRT